MQIELSEIILWPADLKSLILTSLTSTNWEEKVKNTSDFPLSMDEIHQIREIRVLKQLNGHPNIIFLREIIL